MGISYSIARKNGGGVGLRSSNNIKFAITREISYLCIAIQGEIPDTYIDITDHIILLYGAERMAWEGAAS